MNALRHVSNADMPSGEIARLHAAGFSLLPLGRGEDGKSPLLPFNGNIRLPLARVLAPMHRTGSACYGVRLEGLAVIDCDTYDPELVKELEARFGASPVHIRTPRGLHLYYKGSGSFPNLRGERLPVDIKRGSQSYVMGPGSVRPDGGAYTAVKGALGVTELPTIRVAKVNRRSAGEPIQEGSRNYALTIAAIQMIEAVDGPDELLANLRFVRDNQCTDPQSVPDIELQKITDWAWSKRLEGKVYHGRNSEFRVNRSALDRLKVLPNASDAIALHVILSDLHGHIPGKTFALDHAAMLNAGQTDLSRRRFLDARRALEMVGLLQIAAAHKAGKHARTYRLALTRQAQPNVASLHGHPSQGGGV